jgi:hypothetical protein
VIAAQVLADARARRGTVFIDPEGGVVTAVPARLPERIADKAVLLVEGGRQTAGSWVPAGRTVQTTPRSKPVRCNRAHLSAPVPARLPLHVPCAAN